MAHRKQQADIKIDLEDVQLIMGKDFYRFGGLVDNVFCGKCTEHVTTVVNYEIYLDDLNDIVLKGKCKRCDKPVARVIETGENKDEADVAKHIKMVIKKYRAI
jgi:hypothetical protein